MRLRKQRVTRTLVFPDTEHLEAFLNEVGLPDHTRNRELHLVSACFSEEDICRAKALHGANEVHQPKEENYWLSHVFEFVIYLFLLD